MLRRRVSAPCTRTIGIAACRRCHAARQPACSSCEGPAMHTIDVFSCSSAALLPARCSAVSRWWCPVTTEFSKPTTVAFRLRCSRSAARRQSRAADQGLAPHRAARTQRGRPSDIDQGARSQVAPAAADSPQAAPAELLPCTLPLPLPAGGRSAGRAGPTAGCALVRPPAPRHSLPQAAWASGREV